MKALAERPSLRTTLTISIALLGGLALVAAIALVALTGMLDRSARDMGTASQSLRMAGELEIDLVNFDRLADGDRALRDTRARQLLHRFGQLEIHIADTEEAALFERVRLSAAAYLNHWRAGRPGPSAPREVFALLRQLVSLNGDQAAQAEAHAETLHRIATVLGVAIALILVGGVASFLVWLRRYALRPVLHIGDAMGRYGRGDRSARAPEQGPAELSEIAARFNHMASALERQHVAQLTFLAGVAHDLRGPLSAFRSSAELLASPDAPGPERLQWIASVIHRQVDRVDRMIGDLLDAVRIEAGQLELRRETCSVSAIAEEIVDLYRSTTKTHEIVLGPAGDPAIVRADPVRLGQVLTNLISNGIKYSPEGSRVALAVQVEGAEVAIKVTDGGVGIDAADLHRIFEPFRRVGMTRDVVPGAGLGLSVSRRIVEAHGGRITVASQLGRGSTFEVRLALDPESPPIASGSAT